MKITSDILKRENYSQFLDFDEKTLTTFESNWKSAKQMGTCSCCGQRKKITSFFEVPQKRFAIQSDEDKTHMTICQNCVLSLYQKIKTEDPEHNSHRAMYIICGLTNTYYNESLVSKIFDIDNINDLGETIRVPNVFLYFLILGSNKKYQGKDFFNSDCIDYDYISAKQSELYSLSEEGRKNRSQIISVFHWDPFANENKEDREAMYSDLVTMIDDSMNDDLVRQKAAVEIVRSFKRIDKSSEALRIWQATPESMAEHRDDIKSLIDQKTKETQMVTSFSKDHGFAEKYAMSKTKGSGTLGAIVRDMNNYHYDRGVTNKFDIETAGAIKQIAEISAEAMMKQLDFQESDYAEMVKTQAEEIRKYRKDLARVTEELRIYKEKHLKAELLEELKDELTAKGINDEEIEELLKQELYKNQCDDQDIIV